MKIYKIIKTSLVLFTVFIMIVTNFSSTTTNQHNISNEENQKIVCNIDDDIGDIDQFQEEEDGAMKFYNNTWLAQKFYPDADNMTGVAIKVSKHTKKKNNVIDEYEDRGLFHRLRKFLKTVYETVSSRFKSVPRKNFKSNLLSDEPVSLTISVYRSLDEEPLRSKTFSADEVNDSSDWLVFDFSDDPIYEVFEMEMDALYIVCHAVGGDEDHCFNWSLSSGNPYKDNSDSFVSYDNGSTFEIIYHIDFCFRSYGTSWSEEGDGDVKRYAVMVYGAGEYAYEIKLTAMTFMSTLIDNSKGWDEVVDGEQRMWMFTKEEHAEVNELIKGLDLVEDEDDIILLYYCGHTFCPFIRKYVDRLGGQVVVILDTCFAGKYYGRFQYADMLMSSQADEFSYGEDNGLFRFTKHICNALTSDRNIADRNHDNWISSYEAYYYAKTHIGSQQHPVFYNGCPIDILIG